MTSFSIEPLLMGRANAPRVIVRTRVPARALSSANRPLLSMTTGISMEINKLRAVDGHTIGANQ